MQYALQIVENNQANVPNIKKYNDYVYEMYCIVLG